MGFTWQGPSINCSKCDLSIDRTGVLDDEHVDGSSKGVVLLASFQLQHHLNESGSPKRYKFVDTPPNCSSIYQPGSYPAVTSVNNPWKIPRCQVQGIRCWIPPRWFTLCCWAAWATCPRKWAWSSAQWPGNTRWEVDERRNGWEWQVIS